MGIDSSLIDGIGVAVLVALSFALHRARRRIRSLNRDLERRIAERTQKLRAETEERRKGEARAAFQAYLLDNIRDPIVSMDSRFRLTSWNKGAEQAYGWRREEVLGRPIAEVMKTQFVGMSWWKAARTLLKTGRFQGELVQRRKDGEPLHVEALAIALKGEDGRATGYVSVNRDITGHVHDREVAALKDREALLKEFLANVSHELRTPLAAILAFAQTLRQGGIEDVRNRIKFIRTIERHAINLSHLVDELLMISELQARGWPMKREELLVADVLWEVLNGIEVLATRRKIKLHAQVPADLKIWADRKSLSRIFWNLVSNSVKYNKAGGSVHVSAVNSARRVLISVRDTGVGIPVAEIPRLFERYQKLENGEGRWSSGSGLGLSIARGMVEAHGGKIWVTSVQGEGTTFYFTLPRRSAPRTAPERAVA